MQALGGEYTVQQGNTFHFKAELKRVILLIYCEAILRLNPIYPSLSVQFSGAIFTALKPYFKSTDGS